MDAARFNDVCRSRAAAANDCRRRKYRHRVPQKQPPPKLTRKRPAFRGWFTWQSGARRKTFTLVVLPGVAGRVRLLLRSSAARRTAIARPMIGPRFNRLSI